jgi:hypothetical protein
MPFWTLIWDLIWLSWGILIWIFDRGHYSLCKVFTAGKEKIVSK